MEIMDRIERFLREFRTTFEDMPQKEYMENLIGIAKNKLDMFNSLREETDHFSEDICDGRYDWEVVRNEVLTLRSITKEQVLQAYDDWLLPPKNGEGSTDVSRQRRPLVVQIVSQTTKALGNVPQTTVLGVAKDLRDAGIRTEVFMASKKKMKMGTQLSHADHYGVPIAVILGEDEAAAGQVSVKDLVAGKEEREDIDDRDEYRAAGKTGQQTIAREDLVATVRGMLG